MISNIRTRAYALMGAAILHWRKDIAVKKN